MNVGLVGVGPWGLLLAEKLRAAGAEVTAYDRFGLGGVHDLGLRTPWPDMVDSGRFDAIVAAAPPETTLAVARAAAEAGIAVLASKPLMLEAPLKLTAPFFIDYVRLWSPLWQRLKQLSRGGRKPTRVNVDVFGHGPVRGFRGLLDYGPHALAFVHDLLGPRLEVNSSQISVLEDDSERVAVTGSVGDAEVNLRTGNGWGTRTCEVHVCYNDGETAYFREQRHDGERTAKLFALSTSYPPEPHDPLAALVSDFVENVRASRADPRLHDLTLEVTRSLSKILGAASPSLRSE